MNDNIEYLQVLVVQRRFCQLEFPVMASLYIYKMKINAKLQEKTLARRDLPMHHVPTVNCVNLRSQNFVFNVLISCHGRFKATKYRAAHVLKLSKLNSSAPYETSSDIRFLQVGRLYFNHDVFSCAIVLLIISLSKTRTNFIYVKLAEPT